MIIMLYLCDISPQDYHTVQISHRPVPALSYMPFLASTPAGFQMDFSYAAWCYSVTDLSAEDEQEAD